MFIGTTKSDTMNLQEIAGILGRIQMKLFGMQFSIKAEHDQEFHNGRIYLQVVYNAACNKTGEVKEWGGRKWYLSKYMTADEIVKTCWCAYEAAVKHEVMETFLVDGKPLFNPHADFESLLIVSQNEVRREDTTDNFRCVHTYKTHFIGVGHVMQCTKCLHVRQ